jgi:hypothetical protein
VAGDRRRHRLLEVRPDSYEAMRAEALRILIDAGVPARGAWADVAPGGPADRTHRPVVVAVAAAPAMTAAVQRLVDAGLRVRSALTPAAALAGIARSRRATSVPDAVEAWVALEETSACLVLTRGGALVAARDLPWGFLDEHGEGRDVRRREDIVMRLGDELTDFFTAHEQTGRVSQVCICGGLPDLRTTTLPLMERLEVEVETLDSLFGIDSGCLPEPAQSFRERASELRLAWAAAAEWPTINLLRASRRRTSHVLLSRAAVVAGVATGFGGVWNVSRIDAWDTTVPAPVIRTVSNAESPLLPLVEVKPSTDAPAPPQPIVQAPLVATALPLVVEEPLAVTMAPAPVVQPPPALPEPPAIRREPPPIRQAPPIRQEPSPVERALTAVAMAPPLIRSEPRPVVDVAPGPARVARAAPARVAPPQRVDDPPPLDAVVGGILFSADRQLAIVDGRVVGRGDEVRGATVVEISARAVFVRDGQGRLRRLASSRTDR